MARTALRGLVIDIMPGRQILELLQADSPAGIVTMPFIIQYRTNEGDLET